MNGFKTDYFPEHTVRGAVGGRCHHFAVALHRMTGWPIAALWRRPAGDGFDLSPHPTPIHVFCVEPSGRAVDAEGLSSFEEITKAYCRTESRIGRHAVEIHGPEAEWLAVAEARFADLSVMRESSVMEADTVIRASESFVRLIDGLCAAGGGFVHSANR